MTTQSPPLALSERLTDQFYRFEKRGRGWQLWDTAVEIEPPFTPFWGHYNDDVLPDDGRRPTALNNLFRGLKSLVTSSTSPVQLRTEEEDPQAKEAREGSGRIELQIVLSGESKPTCRTFEALILSLSSCRHPVSFEVVGTNEIVRLLMTADMRDMPHLESQLQGHFPDAVVTRVQNVLQGVLDEAAGNVLAVDFGLSREFMLPLKTHSDLKGDPYVGLLAVLSHLEEGEIGIFQVLFQPVRYPWSASILRAVTWSDGTSFFEDAPEFLSGAKKKVSRPLFSAVVRIGVVGRDDDRMWDIGRALTAGLVPFKNPDGNELIPLSNDEYDNETYFDDLLQRKSHRTGMLLNSEELASLIHLPTADVQSAKLERFARKSKAAPATVTGNSLILGANSHNGREIEVSMNADQRVRHMHVIGASGTGKSTFLLNLIMQDIERGEAVGVLDPHGDLIDQIIACIPESRHKDVVLVDPSDDAFPIGFNILSAHSDLEKTLLASDLVGIFRRFSTSWGDQMASVLGNAVLAFLESNRGGTLSDLRRFLIEPPFRNEFLSTVQDPHVAYYWKKEFPLLTGRPQAPLLTRLDTFLRPKPIRYMVSQQQNRLDFAHIMDSGKIFLAKLAQGAIGEENAYLLGSLIVSKFHQITLGRQAISEQARRYFWLYCDEFGGYVTPSMGRLLSSARKYRLGLVLAHQELRQLTDPDVESALIANAGTRVSFRVGDSDAKTLAEGFASFDAKDLRNLSTGEAICRVGRADDDFNLATTMVDEVAPDVATTRRTAIVEFTRKTYATPRKTVQEQLARDGLEEETPKVPPAAKQPKAEAASEPVQPKAAQEVPPLPPAPLALISEAPEPAPKPKVLPVVKTQQGKGGGDHKYFQQLIAQWAHGMGWRATIEMPTPDGGSIDVVLEKDGRRIACEISLTTKADHELGNLKKCLAAGFHEVFMICTEGKTLKKLKKTAEAEIDAKLLEKVLFATPNELVLSETLLDTGLPNEQTVRGYKVKVRRRAVSEEEAKAKLQAVSKVLMKAMRKSDQV